MSMGATLTFLFLSELDQVLLKHQTRLLSNSHKDHHTSAILRFLYIQEIIFIKVLQIPDVPLCFGFRDDFMDFLSFLLQWIKYEGENN